MVPSTTRLALSRKAGFPVAKDSSAGQLGQRSGQSLKFLVAGFADKILHGAFIPIQPGFIHRGNPVVRVDEDDGVRSPVKEGLQPGLAFDDGFAPLHLFLGQHPPLVDFVAHIGSGEKGPRHDREEPKGIFEAPPYDFGDIRIRNHHRDGSDLLSRPDRSVGDQFLDGALFFPMPEGDIFIHARVALEHFFPHDPIDALIGEIRISVSPGGKGILAHQFRFVMGHKAAFLIDHPGSAGLSRSGGWRENVR